VTGNTRLFRDTVAPYVKRVVAVNPNQFKVISHSVKKTDPNDARNLALYLEKDLLPEVRMKDKTQAQLASLTQTRDTLVKLRTALKNKVNNILSAHGINMEKEALSSEKKLREILAMKFDPMVGIELKIIVEQIRSLNQSIAELEKTIADEGSKLGRTALVQCALIAQRYSPYLKRYYEKIKTRRGTGKAIIALARKLLGIIYRTLKNNWVFEDFPNFVLAEAD
jgi:transposase